MRLKGKGTKGNGGEGRRAICGRLACAYLNSNMARIQLIRRVSQIHFHYCNFTRNEKKGNRGSQSQPRNERKKRTRQCAGKVSQREERALNRSAREKGGERGGNNNDTCRPRHLHMQLTHACGKPAANMQALQQCAKKVNAHSHTHTLPFPPLTHTPLTHTYIE